MPDYLETTVDKFTFKVATDRLYSSEGLWAKPEGGRVRIGLSDFLQQHSGDVAFADVKAAGSVVSPEDELASIETIKVTISLPSPVSGTVIQVNPGMSTAPEAINQDPYGEGWLAVLDPADWEADKSNLLGSQAYFVKMKRDAELEVRK